jgi:hypothetical protein
MAVEMLFIFGVILVTAFLLVRPLRRRTRRRGSRYYVPTFRASFDTWQSKWTMTRTWNEQRDKARWQEEFDRD